MKIVIFAGGHGTRFWPLSRVKEPKQFMKILGNSSTFKQMVDRVQPVFGWFNLFVSTNESYIGKVKSITPKISNTNIFGEPMKKDVGPAAGLALMRLKKMGVTEPVAIVWADHFIKDVDKFRNALKKADKLIRNEDARIVLMGEKPKFANNNLGWISIGKNIEDEFYKFKGFVYKPDIDECKELFKSKSALINTGYIVSTVDYLLSLYRKHQPTLYRKLKTIYNSLGSSKESKVIDKVYPTIEPIHFDHCVPYNIKTSDTIVIKTKMDWEDPGTLYALKKYLKEGKENEVKGRVFDYKTKDSLIYNYDRNKLVATVELEGMVIINTKDALLVVHKDHVREISDMIKSDKFKKDYKKHL